ncbi:hypothetical protein J6590_011596 [Homalodisca vitripennis]|nr:hypothetical protein J6590_011596 [Homalodisca vitripennis]
MGRGVQGNAGHNEIGTRMPVAARAERYSLCVGLAESWDQREETCTCDTIEDRDIRPGGSLIVRLTWATWDSPRRSPNTWDVQSWDQRQETCTCDTIDVSDIRPRGSLIVRLTWATWDSPRRSPNTWDVQSWDQREETCTCDTIEDRDIRPGESLIVRLTWATWDSPPRSPNTWDVQVQPLCGFRKGNHGFVFNLATSPPMQLICLYKQNVVCNK